MADAVEARVPSVVASEPLDVVAVHRAHADFVWRTLLRLGVRETDAPDLMQDVFVVVHQKREVFDPSRAKITSWLFGICAGLAKNYKKKAWVTRERALDELEVGDGSSDARLEARRTLARVLAELEPEARALVVMFEVEGLSCVEIAEMLGVPVGTVYSRLHAARQDLAKEVERIRRRERSGS